MRVMLIADSLQSLAITKRILTEILGDGMQIEAFEWNTDPLGGMSTAAIRSEQGSSYPIPSEWHPSLAQAEVVVTHFFPVRREVIDLAPCLRVIASLRHGLENVDLEAAKERSITVVNNPGRTAEAVSDFALGSIIDQVRGYARADRELRAGRWLQPSEVAPRAMDIRSVTVGVVGFGWVGKRVVEKLKGFGCQILVFDPLLGGTEIADSGAIATTLPDLLGRSDVVTLHVRLSEQSRGMIGQAELALMRKGAFMVNTARAELIDEKALLRALIDGRLGGAALDVFWQEPLQADHQLLHLPNVTLTPHIAGSTVNSEQTSAFNLAQRLRAVLAG